ncbi:MAG: chromosomal replication initiator protein DnaA, partial [Planctomycetota bacterium]
MVDEDTLARPGEPVNIACWSDQAAEWLVRNFGELVEQALEACVGCRYPVRFVVHEPEEIGPRAHIVDDAAMLAASGVAMWPSSSSAVGAAAAAAAAPAGPVAGAPGSSPSIATVAALDTLLPPDMVGADFEYGPVRATSSVSSSGNSNGSSGSNSSHSMPTADRMWRAQNLAAPPAPMPTLPPPAPAAPAPSIPPIPPGPHSPGTGGQIGFTPARLTDTAAMPTTPRLYTDTHSLPVNPVNTFESYIVGPSNRLPHAAALTVADHPGTAYNPLFLHGSVGLGKTHLLQAIHLRIQQHNPAARLLYISCETFVSQFIKALESRELDRFQRQFRELDCLIIDDIHFLGNKGGTQEEFFHTFNALYNAQKQIVISSDRPPSEIPQLQERLVSRFKCGLQGKIEPPVFETRVAIFRQKAQR